MRKILSSIGYSPASYPIVHITGTSGKGSTAAAVAAILGAAGYRVGLRTSPYLQVPTEKLQLGPRLIDATSFDRLSARVLEEHERIASRGVWLGYADAWIVMTLLWFAEMQVEVAIIEVGAGGRFDSTNIVESAVNVITSVGLDHTDLLGPSIRNIAWHKAGIIKPESTAVIGDIPAEALAIINHEAHAVGARLVRTERLPGMREAPTGMPGSFQRANAETAVAAIRALKRYGFSVSRAAIESGLLAARLPGRLERMPGSGSPIVWIDGAHSADKITALAREVHLVSAGGPMPVIVIGILKGKDTSAIVSGLVPIATAIVATQPDVVGRKSLPAKELAAEIKDRGFARSVYVVPEPESAVRRAEDLARASGCNVLVTGSMYLAGQVRSRWYPNDEIVLERTPWPVRTTE
ncbi:MAG: bifunctional folylpolyglutamate synthase/dihydrofolate synthase, partial [Chloroflexia bacterium]|nr:bifunctional folylpolyglutamate synthase/dihydrofolate synthase [Chloroflexia bacterium]